MDYWATHGTGLYLANLAASIIGWELRLWKKPPWQQGVFWFHLTQKYTDESVGAP